MKQSKNGLIIYYEYFNYWVFLGIREGKCAIREVVVVFVAGLVLRKRLISECYVNWAQ